MVIFEKEQINFLAIFFSEHITSEITSSLIKGFFQIMVRSLVFLVLFNILMNTCRAKIENSTTNISNHIEKSGNTAMGDTKPAASSNNPTYTPAPSFLRTGTPAYTKKQRTCINS